MYSEKRISKGKNLLNKIFFIVFFVLIITITTFYTGDNKSNTSTTIEPSLLTITADKSESSFFKRVSDIFARVVKERTGRNIKTDDFKAKYTIVLKIDSLAMTKKDGFKIIASPDSKGRIFIIGQSQSGLIAGVGKLLRISNYKTEAIIIPDTTIEDSPKMAIRGIYPATHFHNFYHVASNKEVDRIIEDFALWGANNITIAFDMHHYNGFHDPKAQKQLARLQHLAKTTYDLGMEFTLAFIGNEGYNDIPNGLRAKQSKGIGDFGAEICPATAEGKALIIKNQREIISAFPKVDMFWSWPYDAGGCACEKCMPWGGNGFIKISKEIAKSYKNKFPKGKVWLSTWNFDLRHSGDYDGLFSYLKEEKPEWINGLITGIQSKNYKQTFDRPYPDKYPVAWFPEISMLHVRPWMWSSNPLPNHFKKIMKELNGHIVGGWIYSEGIYEDINKFIWCSYFWNPNRDMDDVLKEYARYYLGENEADAGKKLFYLLEKTFPRKDWNIKNSDKVNEAYALAEQINKSLPGWSKNSWRWRSIYYRALVDYILKNYGHDSKEAKAKLRPVFDEIEHINYIQPDTYKWLQLVDKMLIKLKEENAKE